MCIVAIASDVSSRYPFVLAANRDERHARPSAAADWWDGPGSLLAGRDLEAGGTWLGVTGSGRIAAVTNIFEPGAKPAERSRGALVTGFLTGSVQPDEYARATATQGAHFGPFNLFLARGNELAFVSNRDASATLGTGIHVCSNNQPGIEWAKKAKLAAAMQGSIDADDDLADTLIEVLSGPRARGSLERAADSLFIVGETFGTRCTTVVTIDSARQAHFVEQSFGAGGGLQGRAEYRFQLSGST
jgi:uncharacterized protein with NRDE domain